MARDIAKMLAYEVSRKPTLKVMFDHLHAYSEDDIQQAPFLNWIKKALIATKRQQSTKKTITSLATENDLLIIDGVMPDPIGTMRRWISSDAFVTLQRGGAIQVCTHDLIWLPDTGGIWLQNVFSRTIDPNVWQRSIVLEKISKSGYTEAYKAQINRLMPVDAPILTIGTPNSGAGRLASTYGVRFG